MYCMCKIVVNANHILEFDDIRKFGVPQMPYLLNHVAVVVNQMNNRLILMLVYYRFQVNRNILELT